MSQKRWLQLATWATPTIVIVAALGLWAILAHGSIGAGLARLRGETLYLPRAEIHLGRIQIGRDYEFVVPIQNLTATPREIIGADATCGCLQAKNLPLVVPSQGVAALCLALAASTRMPGEDVREALAIIPGGANQRLLIRVTATMDAPASDPRRGE